MKRILLVAFLALAAALTLHGAVLLCTSVSPTNFLDGVYGR